MSVVWTCPVCGRRIPARVLECYCGVLKQQVVLPALARETLAAHEKSQHWAIVGWAVAGILLLALVVRSAGPGSEPPPPPVTVAPTAPPRRVAAPEPAVVEITLPAPPQLTPAVTPAPPSPAPVASPTASPTPSLVEDSRAAGTQAFRSAVAVIAGQAQTLRNRIRQYGINCGSNRPSMHPITGCDSEYQAIESDVGRIGQAIEEADEAARRAWLEPGTQRQVLAQAGVEELLPELRRLLAEAATPRQ